MSKKVNHSTSKKSSSGTGSNKSNLWLIAAAAICIIAVISAVLLRKSGDSSQENEISQNELSVDESVDAVVIAEGASLEIPISDITTTASFYPVKVDGTDMEVLAVRAGDGSIRTAFNTCQSCYTSGKGYYKAEGEELVCQNCGFRFSADEVEVQSGGCNPWPIFEENKTITDDKILISYDYLSASKDIFANWR